MNERQQADLLELFMVRLRININAEPPDGLEPEMVEFARKLAKQSYLRRDNQTAMDISTQARIWHRALYASHAGNDSQDEQLDKENNMQLAPEWQNRRQFPLTMVAAIIAIVLFGVIALVISNMNLPDDTTATAIGAQQDVVTPTPQPTDNSAVVQTVPEGYLPIVTTLIELPMGTQITEGMLTLVYWNQESAPRSGLVGEDGLLSAVGQFINRDLSVYSAVLSEYLSDVIPVTATPTTTPTFTPFPTHTLVPTATITATATWTHTPTFVSTDINPNLLTATPIANTSMDTGILINFVEVVTTTVEIPRGTQITSDMLTLTRIVQESVPIGAILGSEGITQLVNQYALRDIPVNTFMVDNTSLPNVGDENAQATAVAEIAPNTSSILTATFDTIALQVNQTNVPANATPSRVGYVELVVTIADIPIGTQITSDMLTLVQWDVNSAPDGALAGNEGITWSVGRFATRDLPAFTTLLSLYVNEYNLMEVMPTPMPTGTPLFIPTFPPNASSSLVPTTVINPNLLTATAIMNQATQFANQLTATAVPTIPATGVQIMEVTDVGDLQSEQVSIRNYGNTVDLGGWSLSDADGNVYIFPEGGRLFANASLTIYTRIGQNTPLILYWGFDIALYESGETLILRDDSGAVMSIYQIP